MKPALVVTYVGGFCLGFGIRGLMALGTHNALTDCIQRVERCGAVSVATPAKASSDLSPDMSPNRTLTIVGPGSDLSYRECIHHASSVRFVPMGKLMMPVTDWHCDAWAEPKENRP